MSKNFDIFSIALILITFTSYVTSFEYIYEQSIITTISFLFLCLEILLKILGFGLFNKKNGFFHNSWNVFDFILFVMMIVFSLINASDKALMNFTFYRIFHILKLLKIKEYVYLMAGIFSSFRALINYLLIISIFLIFFSITSTFLFSGVLENKCFSSELGLKTTILCRENFQCSDNFICGRILFTNPDNGITNFDNYFYSLIQVLRLTTFESFSYIIILMEQSFSEQIWFYLIGIGIFGNFFFINLILAVLKVKYSEYKEKYIKNLKIPQFTIELQAKTYDLREAQNKGILLKQKLKKTRRFLMRFFRNKTIRSNFLEKGKFYLNLVFLSQNKTSFSSTPYSGRTPMDYRNIKSSSKVSNTPMNIYTNTPLSLNTPVSCRKKRMDDSTISINSPNKIENVTDFIKKSRLSILKNREFDSSPISRKSGFGAINNNRRKFSDLSRANRMNNFHQIFVNRIVKRESRIKRNEEDGSSSHIGSSKSNALINEEWKYKDNLLIYLGFKLVKFMKNKFLNLEKKFETYFEKTQKKAINIRFLSKRIKNELAYESDSVEDVLPFRYNKLTVFSINSFFY